MTTFHNTKALFILLIITLFLIFKSESQVLISAGGGTPDPSAMLEIRSTTQGILIPRMTTAQRNTLSLTAVDGLLIYDTDVKAFYLRANTAWVNLSSSSEIWTKSGNNVYLTNPVNNVGLGTTTPGGKFVIQAPATLGPDDPIFEIVGSDGKKIFVITPSGARLYVEKYTKGSSGGFAVGKYGIVKDSSDYGKGSNDLFVVDHDGTRIYTTGTVENGGGFAVGQWSGTTENLSFYTAQDRTRVYASDALKGTAGGFAVGKYGIVKDNSENFMFMVPNNYFIGKFAGLALQTVLTNTGKFNTFFGFESGKNTTSGNNNVFIGYQSGLSNLSGQYNVLLGNEAGYNITTGSDNVLLGYRAGYNVNTAGNNISIGSEAGQRNDGSSDNIFIGRYAGYNHIFGNVGNLYKSNFNIYIGHKAGYGSALGDEANLNIFIGNEAGYSIKTGSDNIFIGDGAGYSNVDSHWNVYMGLSAGKYCVGAQNVFMGGATGTWANGSNNCYIGAFSGRGLPAAYNTGEGNSFLGYYSGIGNSTGSENAFFGMSSGENSGVGSNNVYLGYYAGNDNAGSGNIFIGHNVADGLTGLSNKLIIENSSAGVNGALMYGDFTDGSEYLRINGNVGIGASPPVQNKLYVTTTTVDHDAAYFTHTSNSLTSVDQWSVNAYMTGNSSNSGTGYASGSTNIGAVKGYNYWGTPYSFSVAGWNFNDYTRCAGTFGSNVGGNYWGALGYRSSGLLNYGVYGSSAYASGGGKNNTASGIGIAGYGSLFGSWFRGDVYGTMVKGERMSLYVDGRSYTNDVIAQVNDNGSAKKFATYVPTSMSVDVYMKGTGQLVNGKAVIKFDDQYMNIISQTEPVIVTITALGKSNGIYIEELKTDGFQVSENNEGKSNLTFTWIAVGTRKGYEKPTNPEEIMDTRFDENMNKFMFNENDTKNSAQPVWWDGTKLNYSPIPDDGNKDKKVIAN